MRSQCAALSALVVTLGFGLVLAQEGKGTRPVPSAPQGKPAARQTGQNEPAERAIRAVVDSFLKAYNAQDATAITGLFTEDAEIEDSDGSITHGRPAIQDRFAGIFAANEGGKLEIVSNTIRQLSPEAAFEQGVARVWAADGGPAETGNYSVFYVKQGGRWLQARIRDQAPSEVSVHDHLNELEWMLGDWVNESDDATVFTSCHWADNGNFLVRDFDVKIEGRLALRGTQRIGWDSLHKQFHTWLFDDEGGFGEGLVSRSGNAWIVKLSGVRTDGRPASATSIITPLAKDRVGWQIVDRTLGGETSPNIDQFVMVRKPPEPAK